MAQNRPATKTPITAQDLFNALCRAYQATQGSRPRAATILLLVAHSAFETGWWKSMWNFNLGNAKGHPGGATDWTFYRCSELLPETQAQGLAKDPRVTLGRLRPARDIGGRTLPATREVFFSPNHPGCCFRAFVSLDEGTSDYLTLLARRFSDSNEKKDAWSQALAGDVTKFVTALKAKGYFTDELGHYLAQVTSVYQRVQGMHLDTSLAGDTPPSAPPKPSV